MDGSDSDEQTTLQGSEAQRSLKTERIDTVSDRVLARVRGRMKRQRDAVDAGVKLEFVTAKRERAK